MKARVTVCLCAYNHEAYIRDALDRLAEQTFKDFKVIACDDGSTDTTYDILKEYESGKLAAKLTVLTHPGRANRGIHHSVNLCLNSMNTEYFMMHASDDFLEPNALEYLLGLLDGSPSVDFLYGQVKTVDDCGQERYLFDGTEDIGAGVSAAERLMGDNPVRAPSMFFRVACKKYLQEVPPNLVYGDWYHNVLLFLEKTPRYYRRPVLNYRKHESNISLAVDPLIAKQRMSEVMEALRNNSSATSYPTLEFSTLAWLGAVGHPQADGLSFRKQVSEALAKIPQTHRDRILMNNLSLCTDSADLLRLMSVLPWFAGLRSFMRLGSVAACNQVLQLQPEATSLQRLRLISQLCVSVFAGAIISMRDFWRTLIGCFRC